MIYFFEQPISENGEIVELTTDPTNTGSYQFQWSDEYFVISTATENTAGKNIWIGSIVFVEGKGWDLENSDLTYQASFSYGTREKTTTTGGCPENIPYDPDFSCDSPVETTTEETQPAEFGMLYKNPENTINRPFLDEGRYEHERQTIFRYSSIGNFDDINGDLDRTDGDHPLTENRDEVQRSIVNDYVPLNWWNDPFAIIGQNNINQAEEEALDNEETMNSIKINSPKKFKKKYADKITNFNPSTDTLEIDTDSFGIDSAATFAVGKNKKTVKKKLAKQDFDFLYDEKKGGLYFNENGSDKGFGDGGIIAILKGAPDLTSGNLEFI